MANDEIRMTNGEGGQAIRVWAAGGFVHEPNCFSNAKVSGSRGILNFVSHVFARVVVSRCWLWAYIMCAAQGSHILAAKFPGFAPVDDGP
jgi:hypothetical protein